MILQLGSGPEFDRIRAIADALGGRASGLGDDCALVPFGNEFLAISTDISIETVHFRRDWLSLEEIGWRAGAGALSDLAAVGADPIGVLASLAVPVEDPPGAVVALMDGIASAAEAAGGKVLGGDLAGSPTLAVDVTVIGRVVAPVRRSGARPGDGIWVTGRLGGARAALQVLQAGGIPPPGQRRFFAHPEPRLRAGKWLAHEGATAMIDVSDGLAGDATHLAAASQVAIEIDLDRLPVADGVVDAAEKSGEDPFQFAARGGEDYELLAALPAGFSPAASMRFENEVGLPLTCIGVVRSGRGVGLSRAGRPVALRGFDHFS